MTNNLNGSLRRFGDAAMGFAVGLVAAELAREALPLLRGGHGRQPPVEGPGDGHASPVNLAEADQPGHGRAAERPVQIPPRGWRDILVRTFKEFGEDQIPLIAAGCTFYTLLALFPGIGAFVALYGLFADVGDAQRHIQAMATILPGGAISLIGDQMVRAAAAKEGGLSLAFVSGLLVAIWSANGAMKALISGLNIAYEEDEKRGLVGKILIPLGFTVGALVFALTAITLAAFSAGVEKRWGAQAGFIYTVIYWPSVFLALAFGMTLLYRYGPSRSLVRWRWISWGSALSAVSWLVMSAGFSFYVANFGHYDMTYGALGAVIGFMTWTWLSNMVFLLGAELNSEIEHQTARDTTTGAPRPLGQRGAVMADTVGKAQ